MFEITGTIKEIFPLMTLGSGFTKREFVLTTGERFPQDLKFECVKERTELVDALNVDDRVTVHFDLRGREWKGKYFVNLNAWKISPAGAEQADTSSQDYPPDAAGDDEIPF